MIDQTRAEIESMINKIMERIDIGADYSCGKDKTVVSFYDSDALRIIESLEKQLPMKPITDGEYMCPQCDVTIAGGDSYCWMCGQAIDWEVAE